MRGEGKRSRMGPRNCLFVTDGGASGGGPCGRRSTRPQGRLGVCASSGSWHLRDPAFGPMETRVLLAMQFRRLKARLSIAVPGRDITLPCPAGKVALAEDEALALWLEGAGSRRKGDAQSPPQKLGISLCVGRTRYSKRIPALQIQLYIPSRIF